MFVQQMHLYSTLVEDLTKEVSEGGEDILTSSVGTAAASIGTSLAGNQGSVVINFLEGRFIHQSQTQCFMRNSILIAQSNFHGSWFHGKNMQFSLKLGSLDRRILGHCWFSR